MNEFRLTEHAIRNHAILFPDHRSTVMETDPELIEIFDNFAFDEILRDDPLEVRTRVLLILASTIGSHALTEYRTMLGAAHSVGITAVEMKEVLYQSVPYIGIARALDFIHATNDFLTKNGIPLPIERRSTITSGTRAERGAAVQRTIFGDMIDQLDRETPQDQRHILHFLTANCFGDHYTRHGLALSMRELVTFAILISMGGAEPQVKGHVRGNAHLGNGRTMLIAVVTQLLPYIGYPRSLNALRCITEVLPEGGDR